LRFSVTLTIGREVARSSIEEALHGCCVSNSVCYLEISKGSSNTIQALAFIGRYRQVRMAATTTSSPRGSPRRGVTASTDPSSFTQTLYVALTISPRSTDRIKGGSLGSFPATRRKLTPGGFCAKVGLTTWRLFKVASASVVVAFCSRPSEGCRRRSETIDISPVSGTHQR
jgi:hypothetical protein